MVWWNWNVSDYCLVHSSLGINTQVKLLQHIINTWKLNTEHIKYTQIINVFEIFLVKKKKKTAIDIKLLGGRAEFHEFLEVCDYAKDNIWLCPPGEHLSSWHLTCPPTNDNMQPHPPSKAKVSQRRCPEATYRSPRIKLTSAIHILYGGQDLMNVNAVIGSSQAWWGMLVPVLRGRGRRIVAPSRPA